MSSLSLDGKTIVITGACGALGVAVVNRLCALGARVAALDILDPGAASGSFEAGADQVAYHQCDTADEAKVAPTLDTITRQTGVPDTVRCHTGIVHVAAVQAAAGGRWPRSS